MSDYGRFAFEPLLNLVDGRPGAIEVQRCLDRDRADLVARRVVWGTRQFAEFDAGIAIASVLHATGYDSTVPLHVDLTAGAVVAARPRVMQLPAVLRSRAGERPIPPLVLEVGPGQSAGPHDAFAEGLAELRAAGFGIAFDGVGRGFGLDAVAELAPDLVKIEAALVERLPTDPRARVVVSAVCDVARTVGARVAAVGVTHREELAALRDHGIAWAQGPLLAIARRRPSVAGILLPVELMPRIHAARSAPVRAEGGPPGRQPPLPTVASLLQPPVLLSDDVTAEVVRQAFVTHPQAGCVVLTDASRRPTGFLDRNRFMIAVSGLYGHALHARRPAAVLAEPPRTVGTSTDVPTALEYCLADRQRSWDDLVLLDGALACAGVVRVADLLQVATGCNARSDTGSVA